MQWGVESAFYRTHYQIRAGAMTVSRQVKVRILANLGGYRPCNQDADNPFDIKSFCSHRKITGKNVIRVSERA
jgi:hypothetical protein